MRTLIRALYFIPLVFLLISCAKEKINPELTKFFYRIDAISINNEIASSTVFGISNLEQGPDIEFIEQTNRHLVDYTDWSAIKVHEGNKIIWVTAFEVKLKHFVIMASSDGKQFYSVGEVLQNTNKSYSFIDSLN